jgi:hypothetical protein
MGCLTRLIPSGGGQTMRCVFGNVVAGGLALALSSGLGWAQTPKANPAGAPKGAEAEAADINGGPVQMVATASLHLANAVADLREKNLDGAVNKIVLAAKAMRGLTAALGAEQDKADALARDLEAARAEIAALKPRAAAQAGLAQEQQRSDQRKAELKQERQKVEALTRELAAARADQASLSEERRRAEILGKLVQEFKREDALKRERQAARADAAPKPAGSGQNGSSEPMPTADRASRVPALSQSVQAQRASDGAGQGGAGVQTASLGSTITGRSEVVNNATLRINGSIVRLIGVEPASEAEREQMAHYLGDRTVTCWPVSSGVRHRCEVEGNDLSRVVLYNGGGRATADATPDLLADENHARLARIGVWRE